MFDISALHRQYMVYKAAKNKYKYTEKLLTKYFKKHSNELKKDISEYESVSFIKPEESKRFLASHDALRRYYRIKYLKVFYDDMRKKYENDVSLIPQNERFIAIRDTEEKKENDILAAREYKITKIDFINLQTGDAFPLEVTDEQEIDFVISLLDKANSYIGEVSSEDISLIMNIYDDIKNKHDDHQFTNNELYNEYKRTKQSFDITRNELLYGNLQRIVEKSEEDFKNGLITEDEHKINKYMLTIVSSKDLEDLYIGLDDDEKKFFISAYKKLSSYEYFKRYQLYFRTSSKIINEDVSLSNKKKK